MTRRIATALVLACLAATTATSGARGESGVLGDRLVLSINSVPYTQRQVELYITIKESLRKSPDGHVRQVAAGNWGDALQVFSEDMVILQEAQRLGSFQGEGQALQRFDAIVKERIAKNPEMRDALLRLGADQRDVAQTLETVLRIAAFRRNKDRQAQLVGQGPGQADEPEVDAVGGRAVARWLSELADRAVVRRYEGAATYQMIQPAIGRSVDGL